MLEHLTLSFRCYWRFVRRTTHMATVSLATAEGVSSKVLRCRRDNAIYLDVTGIRQRLAELCDQCRPESGVLLICHGSRFHSTSVESRAWS
jgi:hypothetical protein